MCSLYLMSMITIAAMCRTAALPPTIITTSPGVSSQVGRPWLCPILKTTKPIAATATRTARVLQMFRSYQPSGRSQWFWALVIESVVAHDDEEQEAPQPERRPAANL